VLEGKLIDPFRVRIDEASAFVDAAVARRLLGRRARIDRPRLGYREVAAVDQPRDADRRRSSRRSAVTTHHDLLHAGSGGGTVHWFLCGVFNSFVANYLVQACAAGTHVPAPGDPPAARGPCRRKTRTPSRSSCRSRAPPRAIAAARAELKARVARAYVWTSGRFHPLSSDVSRSCPRTRGTALAAFPACEG
jgi:hypothetical protein